MNTQVLFPSLSRQTQAKCVDAALWEALSALRNIQSHTNFLCTSYLHKIMHMQHYRKTYLRELKNVFVLTIMWCSQFSWSSINTPRNVVTLSSFLCCLCKHLCQHLVVECFPNKMPFVLDKLSDNLFTANHLHNLASSLLSMLHSSVRLLQL